MNDFVSQILKLLLLALPVARVAWTVTHEKIFEEPRNYCLKRSKDCKSLLQRKFFYLFTCEYCFSHYVALFFVIIVQYQLLHTGWQGYLIGWLALVWIANLYMSIYALLRQGIKTETITAKIKEVELKDVKEENGDESVH